MTFCLSSFAGEMLLRTRMLNSQLCSTVSAHTQTLKSPAGESAPFGCYDYLTVYHPEEHTAVMELLMAIEKGVCVCVCARVRACMHVCCMQAQNKIEVLRLKRSKLKGQMYK